MKNEYPTSEIQCTNTHTLIESMFWIVSLACNKNWTSVGQNKMWQTYKSIYSRSKSHVLNT